MALKHILSSDPKSICIGLGVNDPKRIFGTTEKLVEQFGDKRIIEPPTSENSLTGICLGMALRGYSVCLIHQRFDFSLLSFDQIINSISKWKFMLGQDDIDLPILIRLIVGRGWGQGPTHSQSYHSFLSSIPGINVLYPYSPESFYASVFSSMSGSEPTILIEHRWLHNAGTQSKLNPANIARIDGVRVVSQGHSITVFTYGYLVPEFINAAKLLSSHDVELEILTTISLSKIELSEIKKSLAKTGRLILAEPYTKECSICSTIALRMIEENVLSQDINFSLMSLPFAHESTSFLQTSKRYITISSIIGNVNRMLGTSIPTPQSNYYHDIPGEWFKGPF